MKTPNQQHLSAVISTVVVGVLATFASTSRAQVTFQQITNGLVDYYPLDQLSPGTTNMTPDFVNRRDLVMVGMNANNLVSGSHPGIGGGTIVINLPQSPGPTLLVYQSTGQNPLDGSGDFLPFINQRGATMNFWIKGTVPPTTDLRVMAECADNGDSGSFFSISDQPGSNDRLGLFLRENGQTTDPNGVTVNQLPDGTYQVPSYFYIWSQSSQYTTNTLFDNNWHMFTMEIASNGDVHVFVDGNYDPGNYPTPDNEGDPAIAFPLWVTNSYYTTNLYPLVIPPTANPPPNGFVRWMIPGLTAPGAFTAFGGFDRNGAIAAGPACELSDIAFWNRVLSTNEIQFLATSNNVVAIPLNTNVITVKAYYADMAEVGQSGTVGLHWLVQGATNVSITGVGTNLPSSGDTNISVRLNQTYTFRLTAANGLVASIQKSISVIVLPGVATDWNLIQRFDGSYTPTTQGIGDFPGDTAIFGVSEGTWFGLSAIYSGSLDRFNVVSLPTAGQSELVLSPKSGYYAATNLIGYDSRGAITYGFLNGLSIHPYETHTLFFRFSLRDPASLAAADHIYSGLDFKLGVTDFGFATGPLAGANPPNNVTLGPGIHISRYDPTGYTQVPFDLEADDYNGSNVIASYSYIADTTNGSASGLQMNVNYMAWLDISNDSTVGAIEANVYGFWLQAQGQTAPVQLFSGYDGDRGVFFPPFISTTNILNKVYVSVGTESYQNGQYGAFFETNNMIVLDDFYLSKTGYDHSLPRPLAIQSVARGASNAVVTWYSLGSLFQMNTYTVQRKFSLTDPTWTTLTNGYPSGGDFTSYTDNTVGAAPVAFYRITWP